MTRQNSIFLFFTKIRMINVYTVKLITCREIKRYLTYNIHLIFSLIFVVIVVVFFIMLHKYFHF